MVGTDGTWEATATDTSADLKNCDPGLTNYATSVCLGHDPGAAVDGVLLPADDLGGFYSQLEVDNSFWMVDLGKVYPVTGYSIVYAKGLASKLLVVAIHCDDGATVLQRLVS